VYEATPALATGTFDGLDLTNIAGLPDAVSSAGTPRAESTTAIGQRLGPYELINVPGDFQLPRRICTRPTHHAYRTADELKGVLRPLPMPAPAAWSAPVGVWCRARTDGVELKSSWTLISS